MGHQVSLDSQPKLIDINIVIFALIRIFQLGEIFNCFFFEFRRQLPLKNSSQLYCKFLLYKKIIIENFFSSKLQLCLCRGFSNRFLFRRPIVSENIFLQKITYLIEAEFLGLFFCNFVHNNIRKQKI